MTHDEILCANALETWKQIVQRITIKLSTLKDEEVERTVAPSRNRVIYLIGHLIVAHDRMFPLLRIGDRHYTNLDASFFDNADGVVAHSFDIAYLRGAWEEVNRVLTESISKLTPAEWLERHGSVTEEAFVQEPLRNRMAILLSRTNHASFHYGQIILPR
jgi:hypothetical protein